MMTFNIRTLNRVGQRPEVTTSAIDHKRHNMRKRTRITP